MNHHILSPRCRLPLCATADLGVPTSDGASRGARGFRTRAGRDGQLIGTCSGQVSNIFTSGAVYVYDYDSCVYDGLCV